jgi:D-serine deaminase-like pyridoxal phosphate-dependent protein
MKLAEVDTPAVLIELDRVNANLQKAQAHADANGLTLRPHIKTHKLPRFAKAQVGLGAIGITVQKLGEAEVMADAGLTDIFLPYNILGAAKLERLKALHRRITIRVTADSETTIDGLADAFAGEPTPLDVLIECDTGMGRAGVQTPAEALALARLIHAAPGLNFAGLMTYPAAGKPDEALAWLGEAKAALDAAGLPPAIISSGGTPDLFKSKSAGIVTEYRPGTYIYLDRYQVAQGVGTLDDCALTVLATVVSRPTENRAIIDAGSKALTSDTLGLTGFGHVVEYPDAKVVGLSEEHGTIDLTDSTQKPKVGDRIRIVPNHCCVVVNLFDEVNLLAADGSIETVPVAARGKVR